MIRYLRKSIISYECLSKYWDNVLTVEKVSNDISISMIMLSLNDLLKFASRLSWKCSWLRMGLFGSSYEHFCAHVSSIFETKVNLAHYLVCAYIPLLLMNFTFSWKDPFDLIVYGIIWTCMMAIQRMRKD